MNVQSHKIAEFGDLGRAWALKALALSAQGHAWALKPQQKVSHSVSAITFYSELRFGRIIYQNVDNLKGYNFVVLCSSHFYIKTLQNMQIVSERQIILFKMVF